MQIDPQDGSEGSCRGTGAVDYITSESIKARRPQVVRTAFMSDNSVWRNTRLIAWSERTDVCMRHVFTYVYTYIGEDEERCGR